MVLVPDEEDYILNPEYEITGFSDYEWLAKFLRICSPEQQNAIWMYVKLMALEGVFTAERDAEEFWVDWHWVACSKTTRLRWRVDNRS